MKKILFLVLVVLIVISSHFIYSNYDSSGETPDVRYIHGMSLVNPEISEATVGFADYVFVAKIESLVKTIYPENFPNPVTVFNVEVIENIKGKLRKKIIQIHKVGGITKDGESIILYEGDTLPEVGKMYILLANADSDGSLVVGAANTVIGIETDKISDIHKSNNYREYVQAVKNEEKYERIRYKAKDDEEY